MTTCPGRHDGHDVRYVEVGTVEYRIGDIVVDGGSADVQLNGTTGETIEIRDTSLWCQTCVCAVSAEDFGADYWEQS